MNKWAKNIYIPNKVAQWLGVFFTFFLCFSGCQRSKSLNMTQAVTEQVQTQKTERVLKVSEPFNENQNVTFSADLHLMKSAWEKFIKAGHYRLAQVEDFRFSEAAKKNMRLGTWERYVTQPYIWWWGAFAAIVVDTTRTDDKRFGLVIFPYTGATTYKPVWLYRNKDLSTTGLEQASGYWFVNTYSEDGVEKVCEIDPDRKSKGYICH